MIATKILLRSLARVNPFSYFIQKPYFKVAATTLGLGITTWFTTIKLSSE